MTVWWEVENALEAIIADYERVNHFISLNQDNNSRRLGLEKVGATKGIALELGSGPGNFTRMIMENHRGPIVCLDYSNKMILFSYKHVKDLHFVRGVFEFLPFREATIDFIASGYALRDSLNKPLAYSELSRVLNQNGLMLLVDIGKPDNPIFRGFMAVYMKFFVPLIGGLVSGYGYRNPWSVLYDTFKKLPTNSSLRQFLMRFMKKVEIYELMLGAQVIALGRK